MTNTIQKRLDVYKHHNIVPTLSMLFYTLVSLGIISNSCSGYQRLGKYISRAQKTGKLSSKYFEDQNMNFIQDLDDRYIPLIEYINHEISVLENIPYIYARTIPRWHNQSHYVEIWVEKQELMSTFRSVLRERQVRIVPINQFNPFSSINENVKRLGSYIEQDKKVHINYFGDLDSFSENIHMIFTNKFLEEGLDIDFKRIAINEEQIKKYDLPENYKIVRSRKSKKIDPSIKSFRDQNYENLQIELDTFPAVAPHEFKKTILESVDRFFDLSIFDKAIHEHSPIEIRSKVKSQVLRFVKKIENTNL
ncbi:MAG TPA: hypothetical protein VJ767_00690 [Nitrososphaeraceae archaeon]|nr:hypothetical protein [Nitrososphaeraceae archaeon]